MKYWLGIFIMVFCCTTHTYAQKKLPSLTLTARGVAIYGWKGSVESLLYQKKQNWLFPIASITKLVTAKAAEAFFTKSSNISAALPFFVPGSKVQQIPIASMYNFEDTLRALLISSNNDAGIALSANAGDVVFLSAMNTFLKEYFYTNTIFYNPTGLDPVSSNDPLNRLTPYNTMRLVHDIYTTDPLLTSILSQKEIDIQNKNTGEIIRIRSSNDLNTDPFYKDKILVTKTGRTNRAGENMVFITPGVAGYDYEVVVLFASKNRNTDGRAVIDWLGQLDSKKNESEDR
jgi:D-alanyl-D-alanine carboxypeptidase